VAVHCSASVVLENEQINEAPRSLEPMAATIRCVGATKAIDKVRFVSGATSNTRPHVNTIRTLPSGGCTLNMASFMPVDNQVPPSTFEDFVKVLFVEACVAGSQTSTVHGQDTPAGKFTYVPIYDDFKFVYTQEHRRLPLMFDFHSPTL